MVFACVDNFFRFLSIHDWCLKANKLIEMKKYTKILFSRKKFTFFVYVM